MSFYGRLKRYPFPFKGAIWAFWLLALIPSLWGAVFPCGTDSDYFYTTYPTLAVLACLWEAHARQLISGVPANLNLIVPIMGRAITNLLILIFFSLLIAVPVALFLPAYQCYTDRTKVTELILATIPLRNEIEERVKVSGTLEKSGVNMPVKTEGRVSAGLVSDTGTIILISENPPAVVTMTPKLLPPENRSLQWQCMGYPKKITPLSCRHESTK